MRLNALSLLAFLGVAVTSAYAETGDASDQFFNAYLAFQKGERAEASGNFRAAASAYRQTLNSLDAVTARWPNWNPPVVRFRREKAADGVARMEERLDAATPAASSPERRPAPPMPAEGALPAGGETANPIPDSFPTAPSAPSPRAEPVKTSARRTADPIKEIQSRIEDLQHDLNATRDKLDKVAQEKADIAKKYEDALKQAKEATQKMETLQRKSDQAENTLAEAEKSGSKSGEELKALRNEVAEAKRAYRQMQIERDAELELNEQYGSRLKASQAQIANLSGERDAAKKASAEVPKKLAEMQKQIDLVMREKGDLETKLTKVQEQLTKVTAERDSAVQEVAKMREASKNVDKLLSDNAALMAKLSTAEKQIVTFKADGVEKEKKIADLNKELAATRTQLTEAQKQSANYQAQMNQLRTDLEAQAKDLAQAKMDTATGATDRKKLAEENDLLRGIILRQQKEQAHRDRVKKLVLEQLAKLEVNSKAVKDQINLLGSPVVKLTEKERKLFKEPQLSISDTDITFAAPDAPKTVPDPAAAAPGAEIPAAVEPAKAAGEPEKTAATAPAPAVPAPDATKPAANPPKTAAATPPPVVPKPATPAPAPEPAKPAADAPVKLDIAESAPMLGDNKIALASSKAIVDKTPTGDDLPSKDSAPTSRVGRSSTGPAVPASVVGLAKDAKDQFERGNYREAEKIYIKAAAKAPNNLYVLSNLGVTQFRQQKYQMAEESFLKAIANAPEDDFSHCTLGIVYYQKGDFDKSIQSLTRALAINPKNPTAHNYLGITASQKGWQEAAQKELETAVALEPNYADAHFNLAVVFATQNPANREEARKHYKRAVELGAEPDQELEKMVK